MTSLRLLIARHRGWALWLVAMASVMKVMVPAGYMPVAAHGRIAIAPCSGFGPERIAMAGMADHDHRHDGSRGRDMPCGFAGHAPGSMAGADPILLVAAIALIVATAFRMPPVRQPTRTRFLRPMLRGPPAIA